MTLEMASALNLQERPTMPRKNKYNAVKCEHPDWGKFDSKGEMSRYGFLVQMQKAGLITEMDRQISFPLIVNGYQVCRYVADFVYTRSDKKEVIEDFKGKETDVFKIKAALFKAIHGRTISVVKTIREWK